MSQSVCSFQHKLRGPPEEFGIYQISLRVSFDIMIEGHARISIRAWLSKRLDSLAFTQFGVPQATTEKTWQCQEIIAWRKTLKAFLLL